jgi:hypothetical protein
MKVNHTYETIIKNKLDQLNGPDSDIMWGDMKGILDVHMPQKKKRKIIGWWFFDGKGLYLSIAILITLGTITGYRILKNKENIANTTNEKQSLKRSVTGDKKNLNSSENNELNGVTTQGNTSKVASSIESQKTGKIEDQKSAENTNFSTTINKNNKDITSTQSKGRTTRLNNNKLQYQSGSVNSNNKVAGINKNNQTQVRADEISGARKNEPAVSLYNSASFNSLLTVKPQTQKFRIKDIGNKKPADLIAKLNQPQKKGWVIGGSFNFHMPLSTQQISTLNMNGRKGNLVDYLPSVYVQYHLNDKLYLQSEIQYSSPQHTPNHILFDEWNNMTTHQKEENLVYLDKLYYINIPVTIHYSPLKNIQFGSGIQLSHLVKSILTDEQAVWQNGMEGWQKTIVNTQIYSKSPGAASNNGSMPARVDTALQNFKSNDLRMVLDANYNLNKLNIGFSLNIGLTNYLNSKAGISSIHIKDRNEDLKIYLRYKLWDQRRKKVKP